MLHIHIYIYKSPPHTHTPLRKCVVNTVWWFWEMLIKDSLGWQTFKSRLEGPATIPAGWRFGMMRHCENITSETSLSPSMHVCARVTVLRGRHSLFARNDPPTLLSSTEQVTWHNWLNTIIYCLMTSFIPDPLNGDFSSKLTYVHIYPRIDYFKQTL